MRKLDIQGLTMSFGPVRAVDNVSLQVDEGETVVGTVIAQLVKFIPWQENGAGQGACERG